jgi:sugar transferase (PEP-CTERM system associated)
MASIGGQVIPRRTLFLICTEGLLTSIAILLAMIFVLPSKYSPWGLLTDTSTLWRFFIAVVICMLSFYYNDLYDLQLVRSMAHTSVKLTRGVGCALLVMAGICLFNPRLSPGRGVFPIAAPAIILLMISSRMTLRSSAKRSHGAERILLAGSGSLGRKVIAELQDRPDFNYSVVGLLSEGEDSPYEWLPMPNLGSLTDLEKVVKEQSIDRIVLSMRERRGGMPLRELMRLKFQGVQIEDPHSLYERVTGRIVIENLSPSFFIFSNGFKTSRPLRWIKRAIDLVVALLGLILSAPIALFVALAILIEDGGPIFYCQDRVGLNENTFRIFKFRSMRTSAPNVTPSWTKDRDSRITRVGKYLRLFRVDELPQFLNVLRGDMSLIGPRPEQPYFCTRLEEKIPYFSYRHSVRPGITGWAQIKYGYGATTEDAIRKLELDLFYIKHLSLLLDVAVIFETVKVVLFGRGK